MHIHTILFGEGGGTLQNRQHLTSAKLQVPTLVPALWVYVLRVENRHERVEDNQRDELIKRKTP